MRLGGPILEPYSSPDEWVALLREHGYRAAPCPVKGDDPEEIAAYAEAAQAAGIVIAEVGAWSNPISSDPVARTAAIDLCKRKLSLADRIGARCCVNIAGSRGGQWDGPHPDNFSQETFDLIVSTVQEIIDAVQPERTCYTLETMPWIFPDGPDSYLELIEAIDRDRFAVHLDPVNMVNSARRYFNNAELLRESFAKLGSHIRSIHAKDIAIERGLTLHLNEVRPGTGGLDYRVFLEEADRLDPDTPILLEHLPNDDEYRAAAEYLRSVADELGVAL